MVYAFCCGATFFSPILRIGNWTYFDLLSVLYISLNRNSIFYHYKKHRQLFYLIMLFTLIYFISTLYNYYFSHQIFVAYQSLIRYPIFFLTYLVFIDYISKNIQITYSLLLPFIMGVLWISFSQWIYAYDLGVSVLNTWEYFSFYGLHTQYDQSALNFSHESINPNDIGGITALVLPVLYLVYVYRIIKRYLLLILIIYLNISMYYTGQKTAMIPMGIFDIFLIYYHCKYNIKIKYLNITLFIIPIIIYYYHDYIVDIISRLISRFSRKVSITSRMDLKLKALEIFSDNPIIGGGHDSFLIHKKINDPHDWNVQILSDTGILGFTVYCLILFYILKYISSVRYGISYMCIFIYIILSSSIGTNFSGHTFWVTIAILGSFNVYQKNKLIYYYNK